MAQHYGLATDMLDVTSHFDVASFFAVCRWDDQERCYLPEKASQKPGVIYRIIPALLTGIVSTEAGEEVFEQVGWQPLNRPEQQRACGVKLKNGQDFMSIPTAQKFYFRHDLAISERIWNAFDQGKAVFPDDPAAILADKARRLESFTRKQVDQAWKRLELWRGQSFESGERMQAEATSGLRNSDNPFLTWDGLGMEKNETALHQQLSDLLGRVRFRRVFTPKASQ
jgi:hypothetical protein